MFYFSFLSFGKHWRARAQGEHPYPFVLAVNKSPSVYFLSRALDGLWRETRGSVNSKSLRSKVQLNVMNLDVDTFIYLLFYCGSISFPPCPNTSHKHLEQVVDSNIFKSGGCGTVLSVTCNKIQTEEKKECLKTFGDDCKPRIQKNAALLLSQGKKYPFKLGILWDLSLNTIPNSNS